ncbi:MAG: hypothetical protein L0Y58_00995, partial [Verrucomicrobia subdivision 3 bacterium]|nr:hypothetical protein [Limisphaerales bacterium]
AGHVISTIEIIDSIDDPPREVCAAAEGTLEGATLTVELDCFVRPVDLRHKEQHSRPPWLPAAQVVRESVDITEAAAVTRDIFRGWVSKVRSSIPEQKGSYATEIYN